MTDDTTRRTDLEPDEHAAADDAAEPTRERDLPADYDLSSPVGWGAPAEPGSASGTSEASGPGVASHTGGTDPTAPEHEPRDRPEPA